MKIMSILITAGLLAGSQAVLAMPEGGMEETAAERESMMENHAQMQQERTDMMEERDETREERAGMREEGEPAAPPAAAAGQAGETARGEVARAIFATGIVDREPVDTVEKLPADRQKIYFFTELRGMAGQTATHRWEHDGKVQAEVKFDVRGPRWRVWSSKNLPPDATGEWKVSVINGNGEVISEEVVNITPPEAVDLDTTGTVTQPAP